MQKEELDGKGNGTNKFLSFRGSEQKIFEVNQYDKYIEKNQGAAPTDRRMHYRWSKSGAILTAAVDISQPMADCCHLVLSWSRPLRYSMLRDYFVACVFGIFCIRQK